MTIGAMPAATAAVTTEYCQLTQPVHRKGCPCKQTSTYRTSTLPQGARTQLIHEFTTMQLVHQTKTGQVKNSLPLDKIHHELETESLHLSGSGAANILVSKVSFDCLIVDKSGKEHREYLSFDLRVPGANTENEAVFSYDLIEKAYGSKANLYAAMKHFHTVGHAFANPQKQTHGHLPDYDAASPKHDQYIRHTEQMLVAYLATPQAAQMLCNRLRTELRGKYPDACQVKVYNMGLHMHSTKSCCAPCEYTLLGLMRDQQGLRQNGTLLGFLPNFTTVSALPNESLRFTLPKKSHFRLLVTVTASGPDADHRKKPTYTVKKQDVKTKVLPHVILVKDKSASAHIFETLLLNGYDARRLPPASTLGDKTVGISGSKATPGSRGTVTRVNTTRATAANEIEEYINMLNQFSQLKI